MYSREHAGGALDPIRQLSEHRVAEGGFHRLDGLSGTLVLAGTKISATSTSLA